MKSIIFDMDGTLVNSGSIITNTINHVRISHNLEPLEKNYLLEHINKPHINSSKFFYGTDTFSTKQTKLFEEYYNQNFVNEIVLYDGIATLLERLSTKFILYIATNAMTSFAVDMTKHLKINHFFNDIIGADKVKNPKPHPDMLELLITKHKIDKCKSILIGDSHKDKLCALNTNIDYRLVNWGFSNHNEKFLVHNTNELYDEIIRWSNNGKK